MARFAIRGLLSRKLRTALTAIAIVLGVAMISGTFVLTDSIDQAFDRIFTDIRQGSNAVISGKSAFDLARRQRSRRRRPFDESPPRRRCVSSRTSPRPRAASTRTRRSSSATTGRRSSSAARRTSDSRSRTATRSFNPLTLVEGAWPGPNEVVVDKETAAKEDFEVGETDRRPGRGAGPAPAGLRDRPVQLGPHDRRRDARRLRPADRAAPVQEGRAARRDRRRRRSRTSPMRSSLRADPRRSCPPGAQVQDRRRAGAVGRRGDERVHLVPAGASCSPSAASPSSSARSSSRTRSRSRSPSGRASSRRCGRSARRTARCSARCIVEALVVGVVASVVGLFLGLLLAKGLFRLFDAGRLHAAEHGARLRAADGRSSRSLAGILVTLLASLRPASARRACRRSRRCARARPFRRGDSPDSRSVGALLMAGARLRGARLRPLRRRSRHDES